jgi:hypothetical protein
VIEYADSRDEKPEKGLTYMKSRKKAPKAVKNATSISSNHDSRFVEPSLDDIRVRAYEKYIERGGTDGQDLDDWFQAEKELAETGRNRPSA